MPRVTWCSKELVSQCHIEYWTWNPSPSLSLVLTYIHREREHHNSLLRMDQLVAEESMETPSNQNTTEQSLRPSKKGGYRTMPFIIGNKYISISHTYIYIYFSYYKQYTKKSFCWPYFFSCSCCWKINSEWIIWESSQLRTDAEHDLLFDERISHWDCKWNKHIVHVVSHIQCPSHCGRFPLWFFLGPVLGHRLGILL